MSCLESKEVVITMIPAIRLVLALAQSHLLVLVDVGGIYINKLTDMPVTIIIPIIRNVIVFTLNGRFNMELSSLIRMSTSRLPMNAAI
jgi:hypothetical protein